MKTMDPGYPKPITVWKGIPDSPQGAFVHKESGRHRAAAPRVRSAIAGAVTRKLHRITMCERPFLELRFTFCSRCFLNLNLF